MRQKRRPHFVAIFSLAALLVAAAQPTRADDIAQESLTIPADLGGSTTVNLEALVLRPNDHRPHPLAVINHGAPRNGDERPTMSPFEMSAQAQAFARRGWVAVTFMRRGYGASQGDWAETYGSCAKPDYTQAGLAGAADIAAVAKFMASQPYVSKGQWISVGVSAGGFATLALSAEAPPGLGAALVFGPGRGSTRPDSVCDERRLVDAFTQYGQTSRIPVLWVSAINDHFFAPHLVTRLTRAFAKGGADMTFIATPPFGLDGHALFSAKGLDIWSPIVDQFLSDHSLAAADAPIDVAIENPPPASLDDDGQAAFATYLDAGPNRAFAVGGGTRFGWASGHRTVDDARRAALAYCSGDGSANCEIVYVNDHAAN